MQSNQDFCKKPFAFFEIGTDGYCYCCSRLWNDSYCLGNILEDGYEAVWNGEKAQEIRRTVIDHSYKYCDLDICFIDKSDPYESVIAPDPEIVSFCYDTTCTQKCVYCRDEIQGLNKEQQEKWDSLIEPCFIPMLKNAKQVVIGVAGEVFTSSHTKKLIKRIAEVYPNMQFAILTNGIYCTKENLESLGITDKITDIRVSVPSTNEKVYNSIVRNGNHKQLMENLRYIAKLKKQGLIKVFHLNCVISSLNYKGLIDLTKLAKELDASVNAMIVKNMGQNTKFMQNFDKYLVTSTSHPEYNKLVKILKNPILADDKYFIINDHFRHLKPVSFIDEIKNRYNYIRKYGWK